jgi:hypothetical protein
MRFNTIVEHALERTTLKRVRLKTDPNMKDDLHNADAYEGYVIEEQEGMLRIMVVAPKNKNSTIDARPEDVEPTGERTLEQFKQFTLDYLHAKKKCDCTDSTHTNILGAQDIQHVEAFLRERGVEHDEFIKIIKLFLMT